MVSACVCEKILISYYWIKEILDWTTVEWTCPALNLLYSQFIRALVYTTYWTLIDSISQNKRL